MSAGRAANSGPRENESRTAIADHDAYTRVLIVRHVLRAIESFASVHFGEPR
jgi:hypothetical protein